MTIAVGMAESFFEAVAGWGGRRGRVLMCIKAEAPTAWPRNSGVGAPGNIANQFVIEHPVINFVAP
jgi:hypothetical protein